MTIDFPIHRTIEVIVPPVAVDADLSIPIGTLPFRSRVVSAEYVPSATITGASTDNRSISVTALITGSPALFELTFGSGVNANANTRTPLEAADASEPGVDEDWILGWTSEHNGSGLVDPGGLLIIGIERDFDVELTEAPA